MFDTYRMIQLSFLGATIFDGGPEGTGSPAFFFLLQSRHFLFEIQPKNGDRFFALHRGPDRRSGPGGKIIGTPDDCLQLPPGRDLLWWPSKSGESFLGIAIKLRCQEQSTKFPTFVDPLRKSHYWKKSDRSGKNACNFSFNRFPFRLAIYIR